MPLYQQDPVKIPHFVNVPSSPRGSHTQSAVVLYSLVCTAAPPAQPPSPALLLASASPSWGPYPVEKSVCQLKMPALENMTFLEV